MVSIGLPLDASVEHAGSFAHVRFGQRDIAGYTVDDHSVTQFPTNAPRLHLAFLVGIAAIEGVDVFSDHAYTFIEPGL